MQVWVSPGFVMHAENLIVKLMIVSKNLHKETHGCISISKIQTIALMNTACVMQRAL